MKFLFGAGVLLLLLSAGAIPAGAAVTKTTVESITEIQAPFEVSPFSMEICENRFTDTNTVWWKDEMYWRQAVNEEITGTCDGGISFECTSQSRTSARDTATSTGICRFTFPDGNRVQKVFHRTYANGDERREFTKWR